MASSGRVVVTLLSIVMHELHLSRDGFLCMHFLLGDRNYGANLSEGIYSMIFGDIKTVLYMCLSFSHLALKALTLTREVKPVTNSPTEGSMPLSTQMWYLAEYINHL